MPNPRNRFINARLLAHGISLFTTMVAVFALLAPDLAHAQFRQPPSAPFTTRLIRDAQGFDWAFDPTAGLSSGSRAFSNGSHMLTLSGNSVTFSQRLSSADGTQLTFRGSRGEFGVERQVLINKKTGTVRFLDTISNSTSAPRPISVGLSILMRSSNSAVMTSNGQYISGGAFNGPIAAGTTGFMTLSRSSSYPSAVVYLASAQGSVRPVLSNSSSSNYRFNAAFNVVVPAKKSITLLHGLAQSRLTSRPSATQLSGAFNPFLSAEFQRDGIPSDIRRQIVNGKSKATSTSFGSLTEKLDAVSGSFSIERGSSDLLFVNRESSLKGQLTGESLTVASRLGEAKIALKDVAAIVGGGGVGRHHSVLLRSGEVLSGRVNLDGFGFEADNGLKIAESTGHLGSNSASTC